MPTNYSLRPPLIKRSFNKLQDVDGNYITDVFGNSIELPGILVEGDTQYSLRNKI